MTTSRAADGTIFTIDAAGNITETKPVEAARAPQDKKETEAEAEKKVYGTAEEQKKHSQEVLQRRDMLVAAMMVHPSIEEALAKHPERTDAITKQVSELALANSQALEAIAKGKSSADAIAALLAFIAAMLAGKAVAESGK